MTPADSLQHKSVLVGITGGIASYKSATLVSRLVQSGAQVTVAMTESATRFITPLTLQALSGNPVYTSVWDQHESADPQHIRLADRLDAAVIAPATMNTIAKLAIGMTDDVVSLILSAVDRSATPVLIAPSMNATMWTQPSTKRNVEQLREDGFRIVGPDEGWQACRHVGAGRMVEPEDLLAALAEAVGD